MSRTCFAVLSVLVLGPVASVAAQEKWLGGRWEGRDVNDTQRRKIVMELVEGGPTPSSKRSASGTVTVQGRAAQRCSFVEDRSGNLIGGFGDVGLIGGFTDPSRDHISLSSDFAQYNFDRVAGADGKPVERPTVWLDEVREVEVRISWRQGAEEREMSVYDFHYLDRSSDDGKKLQRHYLRGTGTIAGKVEWDLGGKTTGLTLRASPRAWVPTSLTDGSPYQSHMVDNSLVPEDPLLWDVVAGSRADAQPTVDPAQAAASCPPVVRLLMGMVHENGDFGAYLEPVRWSVDVSEGPERCTAELRVRRERCIDHVSVVQTVRPSNRPFPDPAAPKDAKGGTPPARPSAPPPFEELALADALMKARDAGKLLAVVFTGAAAGEVDNDAHTVAASLSVGRANNLREKFLFVRRPSFGDDATPTPEAQALRAARSPTLVLLDPWVDTKGRAPTPLATITDLGQLDGGLERGLLEAARAGHPPKRRR